MTTRQDHVPAPLLPVQGFQDPRAHPLIEPEVKVACPACGMTVGCRRGVLNRHRIGPGTQSLQPGERVSPLGKDGWCRATL